MAAERETLGFIGLGNMGRPMARRLAEGGHSLVAHDVDPKAIAYARDLGATVASTPREVGERCGKVITLLPNSRVVEQVVMGQEGLILGMQQGSLLIEMTTAEPSSTRRILEVMTRKGIDLLDAPVSGGVAGAAQGTLSIMVGGKETRFREVHSILSLMGKNLFHMGPTGSGHTMKVVNNLLSAACLWATTEATAVAAKAGLDPVQVIEVIQASTGRSNASEHKFPRFILSGTFDAGFALGLLHKDVTIFTQLGRELQVPLFLATVVQQVFTYAVAEGDPSQDYTEIVKHMERWAGVELRSRPQRSA